MKIERVLWITNPETLAIEGGFDSPQFRLVEPELDMDSYGWMRLYEMSIDLGPTAREDCTVAALEKLDKEAAEIRKQADYKLKEIENTRQSLLCLTAPV